MPPRAELEVEVEVPVVLVELLVSSDEQPRQELPPLASLPPLLGNGEWVNAAPRSFARSWRLQSETVALHLVARKTHFMKSEFCH